MEIKVKNCKIDGKILHLNNEFMKDQTLGVAIGSTLSEENRRFKGQS
jgi:hypothetical protein